MFSVESLSHAALPEWLKRHGFVGDEADLHLHAGKSDWFAVAGEVDHLPERVDAALRGEGIVRYEPPGRGGLLLGGTRGAWRSLLLRFPDDSEWLPLAHAIGTRLGLPVRQRAATRVNGQVWNWGERTYVMGILNVTPDSFSDGGQYLTIDRALQRAEQIIAEGADIIDVGGESTRPGSDPVSADEELRRVVPVIEAIRKRFDVPVSVDTYKAAVAEAAVAVGASMINDVTGLQGDPRMAEVAAQADVPMVLQHIQGSPKDMQTRPKYTSVVPEVLASLGERVARALEAGVRAEHIIVDPGFGFGKRLEHNLQLLARLGELRGLGYPVLAGTSRKTMIGNVLDLPVGERVEGTGATVALAVAGFADIVRVHDVRAMCRVVRMADAVVRGSTVYRGE